jgi:hypothetical protein
MTLEGVLVYVVEPNPQQLPISIFLSPDSQFRVNCAWVANPETTTKAINKKSFFILVCF